MSGYVLNTDLLRIIEDSDDFSSPQIGHLDLLACRGNNSYITKVEFVVTVNDFSPVDNDGNSVPTSNCC